jgi:hypothetical protein
MNKSDDRTPSGEKSCVFRSLGVLSMTYKRNNVIAILMVMILWDMNFTDYSPTEVSLSQKLSLSHYLLE